MSGTDKRNRFDDTVFTYRATASGTVMISWQGRQVTLLKGRAAERFLEQIRDLDHRDAQLVMAKATGNFKRGNERVAKDHDRS